MTTATSAPARKRARVQPAAVEHLGAVMALYADTEAERRPVTQAETDAFGREAFAAVVEARPTDCLLVALQGRHVVGFVWARLRVVPFGDPPRSAHVTHAAVRPEARRHRLVHDLYAAARAWAETHEAPMTFFVPFDKRAVQPWRRRGFAARQVLMVEAR